jgi:chitinase
MFFNRRRRPATPRPTARLSVESLDDRIVPTRLSVADVTIVEGNSGTQYAQVAVRLSSPTLKTVTVNYATADGSATAGTDYTAVSGQLSFARGQTLKTVLVPVHGDRLAEPDEWFRVALNGARNATIHDGIGIVSITNDDNVKPRVDLGWADPSATFCLSFRVSLSSACDQPVTVDIATINGTARVEPLSETLTFAPGETVKTITVTLLEVNSYMDYFYVELSNPSTNAFLGTSLVIGGSGWGETYDPGDWPAP